MRKTPAYLKGLAETRGRLAGDVQRYQQVLAEVTASLVKAQVELNACDTLIRKFDERLDPGLVQPIHAWQGRYGKRGALREAIVELLQARVAGAGHHDRGRLADAAQVWHHVLPPEGAGAVDKQLHRQLLEEARRQGRALEACHDRSNTGEVGRWKWVCGPGTP